MATGIGSELTAFDNTIDSGNIKTLFWFIFFENRKTRSARESFDHAKSWVQAHATQFKTAKGRQAKRKARA